MLNATFHLTHQRAQIMYKSVKKMHSPRKSTKQQRYHTKKIESRIPCPRFYIFKGLYYFATFSKRFIITNIKSAESRHNTTKIPQTATKDKSPQNVEPTFVR